MSFATEELQKTSWNGGYSDEYMALKGENRNLRDRLNMLENENEEAIRYIIYLSTTVKGLKDEIATLKEQLRDQEEN